MNLYEFNNYLFQPKYAKEFNLILKKSIKKVKSLKIFSDEDINEYFNNHEKYRGYLKSLDMTNIKMRMLLIRITIEYYGYIIKHNKLPSLGQFLNSNQNIYSKVIVNNVIRFLNLKFS